MGVLDKRQKRYFEDPKRFADTWNALVFNGFEFIHWAELCEGNPVMTHADEAKTLERTSDIMMKRTTGGNLLAMLVLENQKRADYSIPVRVLLEEVLAYDKQVREIKRYNEALEKKRAEEDAADRKERKLQEATLLMQEKFGKNAVLKGMNLKKGAMTMKRNRQIGGHSSGE